VAGTARHHTLYIWDKASGNLVKILSGQKGEMLLDVVVRKAKCACFIEEFVVSLFQWHPVLPIICSVSNGVVNIWGQILVVCSQCVCVRLCVRACVCVVWCGIRYLCHDILNGCVYCRRIGVRLLQTSRNWKRTLTMMRKRMNLTL